MTETRAHDEPDVAFLFYVALLAVMHILISGGVGPADMWTMLSTP